MHFFRRSRQVQQPFLLRLETGIWDLCAEGAGRSQKTNVLDYQNNFRINTMDLPEKKQKIIAKEIMALTFKTHRQAKKAAVRELYMLESSWSFKTSIYLSHYHLHVHRSIKTGLFDCEVVSVPAENQGCWAAFKRPRNSFRSIMHLRDNNGTSRSREQNGCQIEEGCRRRDAPIMAINMIGVALPARIGTQGVFFPGRQ